MLLVGRQYADMTDEEVAEEQERLLAEEELLDDCNRFQSEGSGESAE